MKSAGSILKSVLNTIGTICEYFCSIIALIMVLLVTIQVILRSLNMPLFGIEELLNFPTIWIYFIGGVCAAYTNSHIECGIIKAVSKNPRKVMVAGIVSDVIASCLSVYVLRWAATYSAYCLQINKTSPVLGIPMPLGELVIFIGLFLMAVYTVTRTLENLLTFKARWRGEEK